MPRARLSSAGIDIAKVGHNVDTATIENMQFSSSMVAMRLALTGVVTVSDYSGDMSDIYRRGQVTFPSAFSNPPIVMVAGLNSDGSTDQTPIVIREFSDQSNRGWVQPIYSIVTKTTGFDLFVIKPGPGNWAGNRPLNWRYFVFQNTLGG